MSQLSPVYLKDYKNPSFSINKTELFFDILDDKIIVKSKLYIVKNNDEQNILSLLGEDLITNQIIHNDVILDSNSYKISNNILEIYNVNNGDIIETQVEINPYTNTKLMGIYKSNSCICSQCEPEGFRRITWYLDQPSNMSLWKVSILTHDNKYPHVLSNGNLILDEVKDNTRLCVFDDPHYKPSYLFALVAGDFDVVESIFTTKSNKKVKTAVYVEKGKGDQADFALQSLHDAMKWDEDVFNLEYDLDVFSIVAVDDFNFGAMENKSLNIFNSAYVLANPFVATDDDYFNIQAIVAHEYFHNFTGNRITCLNWFQLTLKEGLTVFRDHLFSQDLQNKDIVRISEVDNLRNYQFVEDAGPLSHPIRPISYIEMNNFYTSTVYEKGSEVIRMIHTIIGENNFKKGIEIYFDNFDGMAVTCEDFIWSMEQAWGHSLNDFKKWYIYSGTPIVEVETIFNVNKNTYEIKFTQINNPTADQKQKEPLSIPLKIALFDKNGNKIHINHNALLHGDVFLLNSCEEKLLIQGINQEPVLSINRGFSAPIILKINRTDNDLIHLIKHEDDGFIKFESMQNYLKKHMIKWIDSSIANNEIDDSDIDNVIAPYEDLLEDYNKNPHLLAYLLKIPNMTSFMEHYKSDFPLVEIYTVIAKVEQAICDTYGNIFVNIINNLVDDENLFEASQVAKRALKHKALYYLLRDKKNIHIAIDYYKNTKSMTKKIAALAAMKDLIQGNDNVKLIYDDFYENYKGYSNVLNKWFALRASSNDSNILHIIKNDLLNNNEFSFSNPNKVRAVLGSFANNMLHFHNIDGSGYEFLSQMIIKLDGINPSIAASLGKIFSKFSHHSTQRKNLMLKYINDILDNKSISKGLYEVLTKISKSSIE